MNLSCVMFLLPVGLALPRTAPSPQISSVTSAPSKWTAKVGILTNEFFFYYDPVLRIRDVYPGSRIRLFSIPDPYYPSRIHIKEFKYLNPKIWYLSSRKYDPGCSSRIPDPDPDFCPSRIQGSKRHRIPDPQHCYALFSSFHFQEMLINL